MLIFISRELAADSPFFHILPTDQVEIIGESLVAFERVAFAALPDIDWCFFSSRNAVKFFFQGLKAAGLQVPTGLKWGVLGEGTAKSLKEQGYVADFAGNGEPQSVGAAFGIVAEGQRVLFPRAAQSRESIQKILVGLVTIVDLVVYTNAPRTDFELPHADLLVFTSPLNAQAYFAKYPLSKGQKLVAIGQSTEQALRDLGCIEITTAPIPSEEVLAEICKTQLAL
ncbi:uroporphyrinogen-III synthase [Haliscomenobacter sp.]|uniref:uroporphyrinogen-III synthase n=1 Tax=Haliscomenobacter sp. TaxID=2717303 RepID=UPI003593AC4B